MTTRPRVAVDGRGLLEPRGGLRRYTESIVPLLPQLAPDLEWLVYVTAHPHHLPTIEGIKWRYLAGSLQALLRPWWEDVLWPRAARRDGARVLLSPYGVVPRRAPTVAIVHDLVALTHPATLAWHHRWYWRRVARRLPQALRVVVNSATTGEDVRRLARVTADRVAVAPLAPAAAFRPIEPRVVAEVEAHLGLRSPYVLVVAGGGGPRKGLVTLCAAAAGIETLDLVVVGLASAPAGARVRQPGWLDDEQLAALMTGSLAVACPSLTEGFGLPVVEAMACGAAVLASAGGALPEVAGGAALLLPAGDVDAWRAALVRLQTEPELRRQLGRAGRQRVQGLSWRHTTAVTAEAVRQALLEVCGSP